MKSVDQGTDTSPDRARSSGHAHRATDPWLLLQRQAGNRAVGSLVGRGPLPVQRGLIGDMIRFHEKRKAFTAALASTPQGQQALAIKDKYSINLSWVDSGAASFDGDATCHLNQNLDAGVLAGYFVHEMHHVERKKSGASPDADASPVEKDYVDRMVTEEVEGTALGFESRANSSGPFMPGEEFYRPVYRKTKEEALANGDDASTAETKARDAGKRIVWKLIRPGDGTWPRIAPSTLESYDMYYHRVWRRAHGIRPGPPPP